MKAKLLSFLCIFLLTVGLNAQTYQYTEGFTSFTGESPYTGISVGGSDLSWTSDKCSDGILNGTAVNFDNPNSYLEVLIIPNGISNVSFTVRNNSTNKIAEVEVYINNVLVSTPSVPASTTETKVIYNLKVTGNVSLKLNMTSGSSSKDITIDDVAWNSYSNSIYSIQYTTDPSGDSPQVNNIVSTFGTVTSVKSGEGYYIQDGFGDWNGIYISDGDLSVNELDIISVTGTVTENNGRTEIQKTYSGHISLEGGDMPASNLIIGSLEEKDESVLSYITYSRYATGGSGNLFMNIGFAAPLTPIKIDNDLYTMSDPIVDNLYTIYGPVNYASGEFSISPRDLPDVTDQGISTDAHKTISNSPTITAGLSSIVVESGSIYSIQVYNLAGQRVKELNGMQGRSEISLSKGVYVVKLNTVDTSITEKVLVK